MKTVITGGSGFLGSHLVGHFSAVDFSRSSSLDILRLQDTAMLADFDLVVHLAAMLDKNPENSEQVFMTNVEGTINVIRSMRAGSTLVFASTKDVYGANSNLLQEVAENCPTSFMGQSALEWSKLIAERYIEYYAMERDVRLCIFRLSTICARPMPGTTPNFPFNFADRINKGETIQLPEGPSPVRDFLSIDDFAVAIEAFQDSTLRRGLFNLGGGFGNSESLLDFIRRLEKVSGYQAVITTSKSVPIPVQSRFICDLKLIGHELGWKPSVSLDEIAKSLLSQVSDAEVIT